MKKLLSIILLIVMLLCVFTSCNNNELITEVDADGFVVVNGFKTEYRVVQEGSNEIHYPLLKSDKKIESLPLDLQQKIDDYVADCKIIYTISYAQRLASYNLREPYISFTDTFVYDFSEVNESGLGVVTSKIWDDIKALNGGISTPAMYIELHGFLSYFNDNYTPTSFAENAFTYGYFIFENETVVPYTYKTINKAYYFYEMPEETKIIDCGDKYFEGKSTEVLTDLYYALQNGVLPNDMMNRLNLVEN